MTNTTIQPELGLYDVPAVAQDVQWLERVLREVKGWRSARELADLAGQGDSEEGRRWVRSLASASDWVLSGQKGYKHLDHATAEEIKRFVEWMQRQGRKMIERAERMRRNAHRLVG